MDYGAQVCSQFQSVDGYKSARSMLYNTAIMRPFLCCFEMTPRLLRLGCQQVIMIMVSSSESKQHPDDFTDALGEEGEYDQLVQYLHEKLIKLLDPTFETCVGKVQNTTGFEQRSFAQGRLQFSVLQLLKCEICFCQDAIQTLILYLEFLNICLRGTLAKLLCGAYHIRCIHLLFLGEVCYSGGSIDSCLGFTYF